MLWSSRESFVEEPFETESDLESAIREVSALLFGKSRIYLEFKKLIGLKGKTQNVPDGYLLDLSSAREPKLYLVENELSIHEPLKHIAVQVLEFSLSFEAAPHLVKQNVRGALAANPTAMAQCQQYAVEHGFENVDYLLERMILGKDRFNALVIIDELSDELETVLISRFKFPVEVLTLQRFLSPDGNRLFSFEPFLQDVAPDFVSASPNQSELDPSDIDTIVVPAREDGFQETFLGENRWYKIRIHSSMIPKIKYVAAYRIAPTKAITHMAPVSSIEQWPDTNKYVLNFAEPARKISPIALVSGGNVKAPMSPRYTSRARLERATNLDDAF